MKKIFFSLATGAVFLIAAVNVFGQEQAEAPKYKNGDFWHFRGAEREGFAYSTAALHGDYKVLYSERKLKVFKLEAGHELELSEGDGQEFEFSEGDKTYEVRELKMMLAVRQGALQYLQFPLFVGKKWTGSYRTRIRGARPLLYTNQMESHVTAIEEVTTPAGTFSSFKIERQVWRGDWRAWLTYFYSPPTKGIVKWSRHEETRGRTCCRREIELIKFGSAR